MAGLVQTLVEHIKKPFFYKQKPIDQTIDDTHQSIDKDLSNDIYNVGSTGFFDMDPYSRAMGETNNLTKQNNLIIEYRKLTNISEVTTAIDEIVNEAVYIPDNTNIAFLDFDSNFEISEKFKNAIIDSFNEVVDILDFNFNADTLLRRFYTDGQLVVSLVYDQGSIKKGIQKVNVMSPFNLTYDSSSSSFRYNDLSFSANNTPEQLKLNTFKMEEMVKIDSGIYEGDLILSNLHAAIKIANQLQSIEDMIVPLRFTRSIARRVFNVDVGDLPPAKIRQEMEAIKREYKYRKFYDVENGRMSNSGMQTSIVEDYWFPNRNGRGGTQVDVMNETGGAAFGDMGDAEYFRNKLYESLKIPAGRVNGAAKTAFDFTASAIEHDEQRFFSHINRLRQRFSVLLIEILRRHLAAKGIVNNLEFDYYKRYMSVKWERQNNYLERENLEILKSRLEVYGQIKEFEGDIYSRKFLLKTVLKMSDEEIEQMRQEIQDELKSKVDDTDINSLDTPPDEDFEPSEDDTEQDSGKEENQEEPEKDNKDFGPSFNTKEVK